MVVYFSWTKTSLTHHVSSRCAPFSGSRKCAAHHPFARAGANDREYPVYFFMSPAIAFAPELPEIGRDHVSREAARIRT